MPQPSAPPAKSRSGSASAATFGRIDDVNRLVWYEVHERIDEAIAREKSLKKWRRDWKIALIEQMNADWSDLYLTLNQ
jgi:predicted GIY-YIG superfamily endonuclease